MFAAAVQDSLLAGFVDAQSTTAAAQLCVKAPIEHSMSILRQVTALTVAFVLVGLGLLIASAFLTWQTSNFIRTSKTAPGRVVDLEWCSGSSGHGGGYRTVFSFTDSYGQAHTVRTKSWQNPPTHRIGAAVEVLFQPMVPEEASIRSFQTLWLIPTVLAGLGVAFAGIGGGAFVAARKTYGDPPHQQPA